MDHKFSEKRKIVVGINSLVSTTQLAYSNHIQFFFRLGRNYPEIDFILVNPARMSIDRMRNLCANTALEYNADYILFLDDDVLVPVDGLSPLLSADVDVVAGDVLIRGYPFNHMAFRFPLISDRFDLEGKNLKPITSFEGDGDVVEVDAVGFSFCLLKVSTLKRVEPPWFLTGPRNTEDIYYCVKMKRDVPDATIKVCTQVECAHILWAETIAASNRTNYRQYMEQQFGVISEEAAAILSPMIPSKPWVAPLPKANAAKVEYAQRNYSEVVQQDQDQFKFIKNEGWVD